MVKPFSKLVLLAHFVQRLRGGLAALLFAPVQGGVGGSGSVNRLVRHASHHAADAHKAEGGEAVTLGTVIGACDESASVAVGNEELVRVAAPQTGKNRHGT